MIQALVTCARRRRWALAVGGLVLATGLLYSFLWVPVVRHGSGWLTSGDLWGTYRGAHFVAWGALGDVYTSEKGLITFPGILILFAPLSMVTSALHLTEAFPVSIPHPTAWPLLDTVNLITVCVPLCGLDGLAERRGVEVARRRLLTLVEAGALWGMIAIWGHPEDGLAIGLLAYALEAGYRARWRSSAWLVGMAVAMQPLTLLCVPAVLAWAPRRARAPYIVRSGLPAALLIGIALSGNFSATWHALTSQPSYPTMNHPTPWVWIAPSIGPGAVAGGPARLGALVVAAGLGLWTWRRIASGRHVDVVLVAAIALAGRCIFEPVMVPYYVTPAVCLALIAVAGGRAARLTVASVVGLTLTVIVYLHATPTVWWLGMTALLVGLLLCAGQRSRMDSVHSSIGPTERRKIDVLAGV